MSASTDRKPVSEAEKTRRAREREQSLAAVDQLLYSRPQIAKALGGVSVATVIRLENSGKLDKVKLVGSPNGKTFHRSSQVHELAAARGCDRKGG